MSADLRPAMALLRAKVVETARLWRQYQGPKATEMAALVNKYMRSPEKAK
jgi:hypothetical protein